MAPTASPRVAPGGGRLDLSTLDADLHRLTHSGLADSTHKTYQAGVTRYLSFASVFKVSPPFPASELVLCYFVVFLARQGLAPATIKTYLAAVRHAQIVRGLPEIRQGALPRLQLVQTGVRRERAYGGPPPKPRLPITTVILRKMRAVWQPGAPSSRYDNVMMWAAAVSCFFGFFRSGEITVPSAAAFDAAVHLAWGDIATDAANPPSMVRVRLRRSKTDQFGSGVEVYMGATGDELCPVHAIVAYSKRRGTAAGPFFRCEDGVPLSKARFVDGVRSALAWAGVPSEGYSGHSFRIGAATAAARAGIQDSTIQALGRWASPAFLRYIRTPREELAIHQGL